MWDGEEHDRGGAGVESRLARGGGDSPAVAALTVRRNCVNRSDPYDTGDLASATSHCHRQAAALPHGKAVVAEPVVHGAGGDLGNGAGLLAERYVPVDEQFPVTWASHSCHARRGGIWPHQPVKAVEPRPLTGGRAAAGCPSPGRAEIGLRCGWQVDDSGQAGFRAKARDQVRHRSGGQRGYQERERRGLQERAVDLATGRLMPAVYRRIVTVRGRAALAQAVEDGQRHRVQHWLRLQMIFGGS